MKNTDPINEKKLASVSEVAEMLGVASETVRRLTDRGAMPKPLRLGRAVRYRIALIESWISDGCPDLSKRTKR